jgi:hypothetical protein
VSRIARQEFTKFILCFALLALFFVSACTKHENIELTLVIENALAPAGLSAESLPNIQRVSRFVVTVTGEDLEEPVVINLDSDTTGTSLEDLPEGTSRTLLVEALNAEGIVVRRRQIDGVTIDKDNTEPIVVSLNTVPLFTNIRNGNRVIVDRLLMLGVGEPGGSLEINDEYGGSTAALIDIAVGDSVITPSIDMGDFSFLPSVLSQGMHTFTLSDLDTGESSKVTVRLVPPGSLPGTGIVSFGGISASHITSGGIPMNSFDTDLAHFPGVMFRSIQ